MSNKEVAIRLQLRQLLMIGKDGKAITKLLTQLRAV
jgi:hypothetical protein